MKEDKNKTGTMIVEKDLSPEAIKFALYTEGLLQELEEAENELSHLHQYVDEVEYENELLQLHIDKLKSIIVDEVSNPSYLT